MLTVFFIGNREMSRGFSMIEFGILLAVIALLMSTFVPSYSTMSNKLLVKRTSEQVFNLIMQTKSEAVLRGQDLWFHIDNLPKEGGQSHWRALVSTSNSDFSEPLFELANDSFADLYVDMNHGSMQIKFDRLTGAALSAGTMNFKSSVRSNQGVGIKTSTGSGRVVICQFGDFDPLLGEC
jgi:type IV fimbrial biogenesis protein FimT